VFLVIVDHDAIGAGVGPDDGSLSGHSTIGRGPLAIAFDERVSTEHERGPRGQPTG
jgi:hypothetical protein